jgi:hypothetical protein
MFESLKFWKKKEEFNIKNIIPLKKKYPCEECLVLPAGCGRLCDKVEMSDEKIRESVQEDVDKKKDLICPDCGYNTWYAGPTGGLSENIKCAKCNHWFNLGMVGGHVMIFQRIHKK